MRPALGIDDMRSQCLHVAEHTSFSNIQVTIAHQRDALTVNTDDAVQHIAATFDPCHHHIADSGMNRFLQDDTITPTYDEREHAMPIHGQRLPLIVFNPPYGLRYDFKVVAQHRQATTPASRSESMVFCTSARAFSGVTSYAATRAAAASSAVLPACNCS